MLLYFFVALAFSVGGVNIFDPSTFIGFVNLLFLLTFFFSKFFVVQTAKSVTEKYGDVENAKEFYDKKAKEAFLLADYCNDSDSRYNYLKLYNKYKLLAV